MKPGRMDQNMREVLRRYELIVSIVPRGATSKKRFKFVLLWVKSGGRTQTIIFLKVSERQKKNKLIFKSINYSIIIDTLFN